jgi:hypothetical protein
LMYQIFSQSPHTFLSFWFELHLHFKFLSFFTSSHTKRLHHYRSWNKMVQ